VRLRTKVVASALTLALGTVVAWEGYNPKVYLDPVGVPTVCYGHVVSEKIPVGTTFSNESCHQILYSDLKIAADAVDRLVKVSLKDYEKAAFISFTFNTGIGNFKRSTMLKYINEGRIEAACHELPRWVYAKGKKLKGLVNRRQAEMELCLGNL
jgi:lysozyme